MLLSQFRTIFLGAIICVQCFLHACAVHVLLGLMPQLQKVNGMSACVIATCLKTILLFLKKATRQVQANKVNAKSDFSMAAVKPIVNLLCFVG